MKQKSLLLLLLLLSSVLLHCGPGDGAWTAPFDPTVCGATPHQWLPPEEMGAVVTKERSELYSADKDSIKALLSLTPFRALASGVKTGVEVYRVRYETQDHGKKVEATAVVAFPRVSSPTPFPTVLWMHGTTGYSDACAPSRKDEGAAFVALMASQGYIAVAPDYIGMNGFGKASTLSHAFLVGEPVALGSLDAVRASGRLMREVSKNATPDNRLVIWGASQGGHGTLFSLLYAPYYAPGYKLVAGVAAIPPVDMYAQAMEALRKLSPATLLMAGGATAMSRWYGFPSSLAEVVSNKPPFYFARELPKTMDAGCTIESDQHKFVRSTDVFQEKFYNTVIEQKSWSGFEKWKCLLKENSLTSTSVQRKHDAPILYVVSEKDQLINPAIQRKSFDTLCAQGYRMNYLECKGAKHTPGGVWSLPSQFAWVAARLAGTPLANVCKRTAPTCCPGSDKDVCEP